MPQTAPTSENAPVRMRDLMPKGFIKILSTRTGCMHPSTLSTALGLENTGSTYWPAIEALAQETDPVGFASWQAAQRTAVTAAE